jgi:hypothetical protein
MNGEKRMSRNLAVAESLGLLIPCVPILRVSLGEQVQNAPKFKFDPDWPKPLPNKWKIGCVTGLAVDKDDNVGAGSSERSNRH